MPTTVAIVPHATVDRGEHSSSLLRMTKDQHIQRKKS